MRKIIVGAQVSMDEVMQAPGGPWEDPTKGFKFGGWVMPTSMTCSVKRLIASSGRSAISCSGARRMRFSQDRQKAVRGRLSGAQLQADQVARLDHGPHDRALRARRRDQDRRHRVRFAERR